jgi:hypothetical protein
MKTEFMKNLKIEHLLLLILTIGFFIREIKLQCLISDYERLNISLSYSNLKNQDFEKENGKNGETIYKQANIILNQKEALKTNLITIQDLKKFKKINSKISIASKTKIDTVFIPYNIDSLKLPIIDFKKSFSTKHPENWYSISGIVNKEGVFFDSIIFKNEYDVTIGKMNMGFFKKSKPTLVLNSLNPYTDVTKINNISLDYEIPFYKKNSFWAGLGLIGGFFLFSK